MLRLVFAHGDSTTPKFTLLVRSGFRSLLPTVKKVGFCREPGTSGSRGSTTLP
ncbi:hypothetical protein D3C87_688760 [compost metagenome]